jgi:histidyl-tRNA synthetase
LDINSPRGTTDIFGPDIKYRDFIISCCRQLFEIFNYREIITPAFEYTEVFNRGIGQGTDIVKKEMYTFSDKKGRSITLRPEGTAPVVRAIIEHKLYSSVLPLRLFYIGNMFRYERPQKGRMREFWQIGVEAAGSDNPLTDAEVIWLLNEIFKKLGFKNLELLINSVGCLKCRPEYVKVFKKFLEPETGKLCPDCNERFLSNPLRIFDCKVETCREALEGSPVIYDHICGQCSEHFDAVKNYLDLLGIKFLIKSGLVRGFDYYTGTIFEIVSKDLESVQNALGGGGRYDNLIEQFGGPPMPSIGFALGIDRTVILLKQLNINIPEENQNAKISVILLNNKFSNYGLGVLKFLRERGFSCEMKGESKSVTGMIRSAEKNGFSHVVIIGEDEIKSDNLTVKNLKTFEQTSFNWKKDGDGAAGIFGGLR